VGGATHAICLFEKQKGLFCCICLLWQRVRKAQSSANWKKVELFRNPITALQTEPVTFPSCLKKLGQAQTVLKAEMAMVVFLKVGVTFRFTGFSNFFGIKP